MTCKDCIHYDVCSDHLVRFNCEYLAGDFEKEYEEHPCELFKDKSRFVELPCKAGDKIYMIAGSGDEAFVAEGHVKSIAFELECVWIYSVYDCGLTYHHVAGTDTYFFTCEEAEAKLEELEK